MGHKFFCSVIYRNVPFLETKRLGASDCTRTQFVDVAEQMHVKILGGGTGLQGIQLSTSYGSIYRGSPADLSISYRESIP